MFNFYRMVQCLDFADLHFLSGNTSGCQGNEDPRKHLDLWNGIDSYEFFFFMKLKLLSFSLLWNGHGLNSNNNNIFFFSFEMDSLSGLWNQFYLFLSFAMESFQRSNIEPWNWIDLVFKDGYIPAPTICVQFMIWA